MLRSSFVVAAPLASVLSLLVATGCPAADPAGCDGAGGSPGDGQGCLPVDAQADARLDCRSQPALCARGTTCDPDGGTCLLVPRPSVAVSDVHSPAINLASDGAFAVEGGRLFFYYTLLGSEVLQQQGGAPQVIPFNSAKVEIDPFTLQMAGPPPRELTEQTAATVAVDISRDGLWMVFGCEASSFGGVDRSRLNLDICIAHRDKDTDPWSGQRFMSELSPPTPGSNNSDPAFRCDASGAPVEIFFAASRTRPDVGTDICHARFDPTYDDLKHPVVDYLGKPTLGRAIQVPTNTAGEPTCQRFQDGETAGLVPISQGGTNNLSPHWTADGQHFFWARQDSTTQLHDILVGQSTAGDGVVDVFLGALSIDSPLEELGIAVAPPGPMGNWSSIISWYDITDLTSISGLRVNFGRILDYSDLR
jgi:hypothetical protein